MGQVTEAVAAFFRWWSGELAALVPAVLRRGLRGGGALVLDLSGGDIKVFRLAGGALRELGRTPATPADGSANGGAEADAVARLLGGGRLRRLPVTLRLPAANALRKTLSLPLAAEENLRDVLSFEMDRQTPFTADQVYFDFRIRHRDRDAGRMEVELLAIPRFEVDGALSRTARWGIVPRTVDVAVGDGVGGDGNAPRFNLLPGGFAAAAARRGGGLTAALAILALLLAGLNVYLPMARQQDTAALYAASLARAKVDAEAAIALRRQVETLAAEAGWLAERKRAAPSLVALLDTLTRLVPDGTWLNRLDMDGKTVRLSGSSPAASTLIGLIENAPQFEKVRFLAPVTRDARLGVERFTLSAGIVGSKPSPKAPATKGKTR